MNLFKKLLIQHKCVNATNHVVWNKVAENPILIQHALLHLTQKCNDAKFLPQEIVAPEDPLTPLALAFASQLVVPLKSSPTPNSHTLFLRELTSKPTTPAGTLTIGVLDD